ncbi:MAG: type II toxin-antitoxin system RelE/ParE family toxin [Magnetococcales bacterium]|nr:type II toxin-antitoxin system RelE/ParE family toxin [Magnetococcales bacterium]
MSFHKHRLDLSDAARKDLRDILAYTLLTWGERQFVDYKNLLDGALHTIERDPTTGRTRNRSSVRVFPVGRHVIFYRIEQNIVYIIRILHDCMSFDLHLEE